MTNAASVTDQEACEVIDTAAQTLDSSKKEKDRQKSYYVLCNLNTPEQEDFIFLFTALYHWYLRYPNTTLKLINDPNEIAQVPKPVPPKQEEKKGEEKKDGAAPKDGKDAKPNEASDANAKPADDKPADGKPADGQPADNKPSDSKADQPPEDKDKLPDIISNKVGEIAKSLQEMFGENRESLSELDEAKIKEHENLLMAELAAIEEDAALIEQIELAKKQSLEDMKALGEKQDAEMKASEQKEEEKKHEVEVDKADESAKVADADKAACDADKA